jgi:hypothetical protein
MEFGSFFHLSLLTTFKYLHKLEGSAAGPRIYPAGFKQNKEPEISYHLLCVLYCYGVIVRKAMDLIS